MSKLGAVMKAVDAVMMIRDAAKSLKGGPSATDERPQSTRPLATTAPAGSHIEAALGNVVIAALKEAFDRDHARLELERANMDDQRRRAETALRAELRRHAAEREIGRLRLLAVMSLVGWIASMAMLGLRISGATTPGRVVLVISWCLLLAAVGAAFSAQGRINTLAASGDAAVDAGPSGTAALWLLMAGMGATAISLVI